jgi:hypothetical protein
MYALTHVQDAHGRDSWMRLPVDQYMRVVDFIGDLTAKTTATKGLNISQDVSEFGLVWGELASLVDFKSGPTMIHVNKSAFSFSVDVETKDGEEFTVSTGDFRFQEFAADFARSIQIRVHSPVYLVGSLGLLGNILYENLDFWHLFLQDGEDATTQRYVSFQAESKDVARTIAQRSSENVRVLSIFQDIQIDGQVFEGGQDDGRFIGLMKNDNNELEEKVFDSLLSICDQSIAFEAVSL